MKRVALIGLMLLVLFGCASTTSTATEQVRSGMPVSKVSDLLGKPDSRSFHGEYEAWQYADIVGYGQCEYITIFITKSVVRSMTSRRGFSVAGCGLGSSSVDWSQVADSSGSSGDAPAQEQVEPPRSAGASGSCFFVDSFGTAVTNNHVISGSSTIEVIAANGSNSSANIIKSSNSLDIAVLGTGHQTPQFLTLAPNGSLALGQDVFTIGYPVADILGDKPKYTEGSISALSGLNNDDSWIQVSTPIQPGNSGGPLVNENGQVVGIVTATAAVEKFFAVTGSLPQNINWAIKAEYARVLMPDAPTNARFNNKQEAIAHTEKSVCRVIAR